MSAEAAHDHHHHKVMPEDWPEDPYVGKATAGKVGMWIFLLSDAFMFAGFLLAYGILRGGKEYWRCGPEQVELYGCTLEPLLGIEFTALLTFLLICSSVSMVMAYAAALEKDRKGMVKWLLITAAGGALFLCGQYYEYFLVDTEAFPGKGLIGEGLIFGQSAYASTFYNVTAFHGAHVLTGTIYLLVVAARAAMGKYDDGDYNEIEICGLFWHFVDLIWILVFTIIYLVPLEGA